MTKFKKITFLLFLSSFLFISLFFIAPALAVNMEFVPQIGIPDSEFVEGTGVTVGRASGSVMTSDLLARYVNAFYKWGLSIVGVIAVLMLMAGGIVWLTSAGDSEKIGQAKKMIGGSLFGAFLLVGAYFFLNTINPDLTNLPVIELDIIKKENISNSGFVSNAEKIAYVCLSGSLTCANTTPPSLNVELQACYNKFGQLPNNCLGTDSPKRFCCGVNENTQTKANVYCEDKSDGTACQINETSGFGSGYCANKICKPCTYFGLSCLNSYECLSSSLLKCGYGDIAGVTFPSNCNKGYCGDRPHNEENSNCGPNYLGKCLKYVGIYTCPGDTSAYDGGTECGSGLKCCK